MSLTDKTVLDSNPELVSLALLLFPFSLIGTSQACERLVRGVCVTCVSFIA